MRARNKKRKVLKLAWRAKESSPPAQPRVWSQKEQTLSIYYLSCQIQDLPRLCQSENTEELQYAYISQSTCSNSYFDSNLRFRYLLLEELHHPKLND